MTTDLEKEREAFERGWVEWGSNKWASKSEKSAAWSAWRARSRATLAAPAARQEHDWKAMAEAARRIGLTFLRDDDGRYTLRQLGEVKAQNSAPHISDDQITRLENSLSLIQRIETDRLERERQLAAPQEQPSDEEAAAFADQHGMYHDTDPAIAGKHARALLSRYGAAPQGGEDAEPVAWPAHYQSEPAQIAVLRQNAVLSVTPGVDDPMVTYIRADLASNPQPAGRDARKALILAADHKGMRVDYSGLFKEACRALRIGSKETALAEMLRQLEEHLTELGQRWYAGDAAVVDEMLQLYCIESEARSVRTTSGGAV